MSAQAAQDCGVYLCPWCGPCLVLLDESDDEAMLTLHHADVEHPLDMTFDEEETQQ